MPTQARRYVGDIEIAAADNANLHWLVDMSL